MKKRFGKFLLIILFNLGVLLLMLFHWTGNCLRLALGQNHSRLFELFQLSGLLIIALFALVLVGKIAEHLQLSKDPFKNQLRIVFVLIFLIFGLKYIKYAVKSTSLLRHQTTISQLCPKIKSFEVSETMVGTQANNLTFKEYELIKSIKEKLPDISKNAAGITYQYANREFTKYYTIELTYQVPINERIKLLDMDNGRFSKSQSFVVKGEFKVVKYSESLR